MCTRGMDASHKTATRKGGRFSCGCSWRRLEAAYPFSMLLLEDIHSLAQKQHECPHRPELQQMVRDLIIELCMMNEHDRRTLAMNLMEARQKSDGIRTMIRATKKPDIYQLNIAQACEKTSRHIEMLLHSF